MPKIIIIDDEKDMCKVLALIFKTEGYDVATESNSAKGLDLVMKESPDCVLLDIRMPKVNGIELLHKIKEYNKKLPVIMMTAEGSVTTTAQSIRLGAYDYIIKPFDTEFIKNMVKKCIESKGK